MNKRKVPHFKADRKLLQNTWGLKKSSFEKKPFKPGLHKKSFLPKKMYAFAFNELMKFRNFYKNVSLKAIKRFFEKFKNINRVVEHLESRIDIILFRSGFAKTIFEARQLVSHKKIMINNIKINKPGVILKELDIIKLIPKKNIFDRQPPSYLSIDKIERRILLNKKISIENIFYPNFINLKEITNILLH